MDKTRQKIRVLYVADQYEEGGASDALIEMIVYLREEYNVDPVVATAYNNALAARLSEKSIEFYCLGHRQFAYNMPNAWYKQIFPAKALYAIRYMVANQISQKRAEKLIDFEKIDIIHSNVDRNDIGGLLSCKYKIPHIWHLRELTRGHFTLLFNKWHAFSYMNRITDFFIAISQTVKKDWEMRGIDPSKVKVLYDGIDAEQFISKDKDVPNKYEFLKLVCVGAITPAKGQKELIEALAIAAKQGVKFELDLYGEGAPQYINALKETAQINKISDYIHFHGYTNKIPEILSAYDIGINPSLNEGFGRVTAEYMAAGLLAIAHKEGAGSEIISNGIDGYLYDSAKELSDLITMAYYSMKRSDSLLGKKQNMTIAEADTLDHIMQIRKNGREKAVSLLNIKNNVEQIYDLYLECIKRREQ